MMSKDVRTLIVININPLKVYREKAKRGWYGFPKKCPIMNTKPYQNHIKTISYHIKTQHFGLLGMKIPYQNATPKMEGFNDGT